ncbi:unnamed protein product, partial [Ixodes hexagonus]
PGRPSNGGKLEGGDAAPSCSGSTRNAHTLTELSCGAEEVELVSLLEEQLPRYRLRADTLTQFSGKRSQEPTLCLFMTETGGDGVGCAGYENEDWCIRVPCLPNPETLDLSPELIQETLNYFVVSGERLSQMTRTYSDPEALTRLLEEKERDLELAAHIGQGLLAEKGQLCDKVEALEGDLAQAQEALAQLRHQLATKAALLQAYAASEEAAGDNDDGVNAQGSGGNSYLEGEEAGAWSVLNRKIHQLEQENSQLKAESQSQLSSLEEEEKKELQLIRDCIRQLSDASRESSSLQEELSRRTEVNLRQQQEIAALSAQLAELQRYTHMLRLEAEELRGQLSLSKGLQEQLSGELHEARVRYLDLREAFVELQAQLRQQAASSGGQSSIAASQQQPSLAHELRDCMARGDSDGYTSQEERRANYGMSIWSEESEESDGNDDSQYSSLSSLGLSPLKRQQHRCSRHLATTPWTPGFRLSDRLQVVKPLEGSETLQAWQRLATPGLGDLFGEQGPGVRLKTTLAAPREPKDQPERPSGPESAAAGTEHSSPSGHASGIILRCCARESSLEADPSWLRLEASLRKLGPGDPLPSVLVRPPPQAISTRHSPFVAGDAQEGAAVVQGPQGQGPRRSQDHAKALCHRQ